MESESEENVTDRDRMKICQHYGKLSPSQSLREEVDCRMSDVSGCITTASSHGEKGKFLLSSTNLDLDNVCNEADEFQSENNSVYHSFVNDYNQTISNDSSGQSKDECDIEYNHKDSVSIHNKSEYGGSFYHNQVNVSIWVNHLRLNYILKIFIILCLALSTIFLTWISKEFKIGSKPTVLKISPAFISVNGKWLFMSLSYDCTPVDFCEGYCGSYSTVIFISSCVHCFGVLVSSFIYIASLIAPQKNVDKFNWLALLATIIAWTIVILINNDFSNLSIGFYSMILFVIVAIAIQVHYVISRKMMRSKILINQLLEA